MNKILSKELHPPPLCVFYKPSINFPSIQKAHFYTMTWTKCNVLIQNLSDYFEFNPKFIMFGTNDLKSTSFKFSSITHFQKNNFTREFIKKFQFFHPMFF